MYKIITAILLGGVLSSSFAHEITFEENTEVFSNPGQGWAINAGLAEDVKCVNVGARYNRIEWAVLQPEENRYDWSVFDKYVELAKKEGIPFYFRIMCANFHSSRKYATPKWVFDKGAKYHEFEGMEVRDPSTGQKFKTKVAPYFNDPIFIEEHTKFIKALAKRYDGKPFLGGLDLGSFGNWGEWHCHGMGINDSWREMYPYEIRKQYADMYLKNFKKSEIFFMTDDHEILEYSLGKGKRARVGMRRDGVGSPWHFKRWIGTPPYDKITRMADVWKDKGMFFEFFGSAPGIMEKGWDIIYSVDWMLKNHVSIVNTIPFLPWKLDRDSKEFKKLKELDLYAGARLVPQTANISISEKKISVEIKAVNKGVSRIYLPFRMKYEIRDNSGKVVLEKISSCKPNQIFPGEFTISDDINHSLKSGQIYSLSLRIYHTKKVFKDFRFASKNLTADGSLDLGKIKIK